MKVYKIVLTGGPCAGKSEILEKLIEYYSKKEKIKVFTITETATEVINSGLSFMEMDNPYNFQKIILERQLNKEITLYRGLEHMPLEETNLIFLDRGIIDNKAYLPIQRAEEDFKNLLQERNLNELNILDSYDLVIDLISLATTNPEKYECISNAARYESADTAKMVDRRITKAWLGHNNIRHIYPTEQINEKLALVQNYIEQLLNENQQKATQTYLIDTPHILLKLLNTNNSKKIEITNYHIGLFEENTRTIIQKRSYNGAQTLMLMMKDSLGNMINSQIISDKTFQMITEISGMEKVINKEQYTFVYGPQVYTITCYGDFTTLDVEITNNVEHPDLSAFNIIGTIDNFELFYDECQKKHSKTKKYGII